MSGLKDILRETGLKDTRPATKKIERYLDLLYRERKIRNIIGPRNRETIFREHFIPSLCLGAEIEGGRGADIGTGAGIPGMVIAIVNPSCPVILMEPKKSRVNFLNKVKNDLGLENVTVAVLRGEEAGRRKEYREQFRFVTCRAVASLKVSSELAMPLLKTGGIYYAQKGEKLSAELKEAQSIIDILGGEIEDIKADNTLIIRKVSSTPENYPRKWNRIKK
ncbi:MAG: 16S rRNA (guanine(527)-N(7))-methyltransferase RsmG [Elusimicrobiota bacterium]|nr:16S rRNA (guanine(527)-N(7))-methyltransferase RsmG [Elusimicrobiota bacterium]